MAEEQEKSVATEEKTLEEGSLLEEIVQATKLKPSDDAYSLAKKGVEALIAQLLEPGREVPKVSKAVVDEMIAEIDKKLSLQLDAILHHPEFQSLAFLEVPGRQNRLQGKYQDRAPQREQRRFAGRL